MSNSFVTSTVRSDSISGSITARSIIPPRPPSNPLSARIHRIREDNKHANQIYSIQNRPDSARIYSFKELDKHDYYTRTLLARRQSDRRQKETSRLKNNMILLQRLQLIQHEESIGGRGLSKTSQFSKQFALHQKKHAEARARLTSPRAGSSRVFASIVDESPLSPRNRKIWDASALPGGTAAALRAYKDTTLEKDPPNMRGYRMDLTDTRGHSIPNAAITSSKNNVESSFADLTPTPLLSESDDLTDLESSSWLHSSQSALGRHELNELLSDGELGPDEEEYPWNIAVARAATIAAARLIPDPPEVRAAMLRARYIDAEEEDVDDEEENDTSAFSQQQQQSSKVKRSNNNAPSLYELTSWAEEKQQEQRLDSAAPPVSVSPPMSSSSFHPQPPPPSAAVASSSRFRSTGRPVSASSARGFPNTIGAVSGSVNPVVNNSTTPSLWLSHASGVTDADELHHILGALGPDYEELMYLDSLMRRRVEQQQQTQKQRSRPASAAASVRPKHERSQSAYYAALSKPVLSPASTNADSAIIRQAHLSQQSNQHPPRSRHTRAVSMAIAANTSLPSSPAHPSPYHTSTPTSTWPLSVNENELDEENSNTIHSSSRTSDAAIAVATAESELVASSEKYFGRSNHPVATRMIRSNAR
jgi:hypothetical protein